MAMNEEGCQYVTFKCNSKFQRHWNLANSECIGLDTARYQKAHFTDGLHTRHQTQLSWKDMSQWELCKLISCSGHFETLQCTVCSWYVQTGKQLGPATGKDYSPWILRISIIRETKDKALGAINTQLHKTSRWIWTVGGGVGVSFTDTWFTFNTSTLLSASAHLCPFSRFPRPTAAIRSTAIPALCLLLARVCKLVFIVLFISLLPLSLKLIFSHSLALFPLSLALLSWHWPVTRVGNFCGAPTSDRTLIYWQCWVTGLFLELVNMRTSFPKVYLISQRTVNKQEATQGQEYSMSIITCSTAAASSLFLRSNQRGSTTFQKHTMTGYRTVNLTDHL